MWTLPSYCCYNLQGSHGLFDPWYMVTFRLHLPRSRRLEIFSLRFLIHMTLRVGFMRQAEDAALICPWKEPCFSWLKIYFYSLNVQVKVIFLTGKMLSCDCPWIFFFFPLPPLSLAQLIPVSSSYWGFISVLSLPHWTATPSLPDLSAPSLILLLQNVDSGSGFALRPWPLKSSPLKSRWVPIWRIRKVV